MLVVAVIAAIGSGFAVYSVDRALVPRTVKAFDPVRFAYDDARVVLTIAPWLTVAGLVMLVGGSLWLWRISAAVRRASAQDRARMDREQAIRAGDVVDPTPAPDPSLRL